MAALQNALFPDAPFPIKTDQPEIPRPASYIPGQARADFLVAKGINNKIKKECQAGRLIEYFQCGGCGVYYSKFMALRAHATSNHADKCLEGTIRVIVKEDQKITYTYSNWDSHAQEPTVETVSEQERKELLERSNSNRWNKNKDLLLVKLDPVTELKPRYQRFESGWAVFIMNWKDFINYSGFAKPTGPETGEMALKEILKGGAKDEFTPPTEHFAKLGNFFKCPSLNYSALSKGCDEVAQYLNKLPAHLSLEKRAFFYIAVNTLNATRILALFYMLLKDTVKADFQLEFLIVMVILRFCLNAHGPELFEREKRRVWENSKNYSEMIDADGVPHLAEMFVRDYFPKYILNHTLFVDPAELKLIGVEPQKHTKLILLAQCLSIFLYELGFSSALVLIAKKRNPNHDAPYKHKIHVVDAEIINQEDS